MRFNFPSASFPKTSLYNLFALLTAAGTRTRLSSRLSEKRNLSLFCKNHSAGLHARRYPTVILHRKVFLIQATLAAYSDWILEIMPFFKTQI